MGVHFAKNNHEIKIFIMDEQATTRRTFIGLMWIKLEQIHTLGIQISIKKPTGFILA